MESKSLDISAFAVFILSTSVSVLHLFKEALPKAEVPLLTHALGATDFPVYKFFIRC